MPDVICNTSPIQYLYQLDLLHVLSALAGRVIVPPAVVVGNNPKGAKSNKDGSP